MVKIEELENILNALIVNYLMVNKLLFQTLLNAQVVIIHTKKFQKQNTRKKRKFIKKGKIRGKIKLKMKGDVIEIIPHSIPQN